MVKLISKRQVKRLEALAKELAVADLTEAEQANRSLEVYALMMDALKKRFKTPAQTIKFFLDCQGQPDAYLAKLLNSRSRASELLTSKRSASLTDIKLLAGNLGIPAELLLTYSGGAEAESIDFKRTVADMKKRGWLTSVPKNKTPQDIISSLCDEAGCSLADVHAACFRQLSRKNAKTDAAALQGWLIKARIEAKKIVGIKKFIQKNVTQEFIEDCIHGLSASPNGLQNVQTYLAKHGIRFIILPHLKGTHLDGAVFFLEDNMPTIAMTLRYDRIDNFWFVLAHELAHLALGHLKGDDVAIFDDLDITAAGEQEVAADTLAKNALIPPRAWRNFPVNHCRQGDIFNLAISLGIAPAIVAGRVRFETKNYRIFSGLVGNGEVRRAFPEVFQYDADA